MLVRGAWRIRAQLQSACTASPCRGFEGRADPCDQLPTPPRASRIQRHSVLDHARRGTRPVQRDQFRFADWLEAEVKANSPLIRGNTGMSIAGVSAAWLAPPAAGISSFHIGSGRPVRCMGVCKILGSYREVAEHEQALCSNSGCCRTVHHRHFRRCVRRCTACEPWPSTPTSRKSWFFRVLDGADHQEIPRLAGHVADRA